MLKKLTKRFMSLVLVVVLLLSFAAPVFAYQQISNGSKGEDVKTMQKMLNTVMNAGLDVDGNCGPKSVAAIKSFQKAYGLTVDGYCGKNTWAKLEAEYNKKINATAAKCTTHKKGTFSHTDTTAHPHKKYYKCANCGVAFTDGTTTKVSGCTTCYPVTQSYQQISNGSKGEDVKTMQKMLNTVMNAGLDVDGNCGPKSVAAIKSFQKAYGLTVDGYCGKNTWAKLEAEYNKKVNATTAKCTTHKKGTFSHTDTAHPHKNYYKCANCGVTYTDGTTTNVSGCTTCYPTAAKVKKYTLTFNANGSGVTNLPETAHIQEGVRMAIPGKVSGVPVRSGYTFIGYSTDKNATTVQYVPGRSIKLTKDTTLYAVWHKKASNLDNLSSKTIEALNKSVGIQQPKGSGKCTKSATATLLKRRQIATGNAGTFSLNDIEKGAGYSAINPGSNTYKSNGNTYTCTAIQPKQINTDPTKYIVELLNEHPEGIVIYCDYYNLYSKKPSQHAVVISDYEIDESGDYRFYAYDPGMSNTKRMRFEETTLYKGCNSAEHPEYMKVTSYPSYANVFSNFKNKSCGCIWYVETES